MAHLVTKKTEKRSVAIRTGLRGKRAAGGCFSNSGVRNNTLGLRWVGINK